MTKQNFDWSSLHDTDTTYSKSYYKKRLLNATIPLTSIKNISNFKLQRDQKSKAYKYFSRNLNYHGQLAYNLRVSRSVVSYFFVW